MGCTHSLLVQAFKFVITSTRCEFISLKSDWKYNNNDLYCSVKLKACEVVRHIYMLTNIHTYVCIYALCNLWRWFGVLRLASCDLRLPTNGVRPFAMSTAAAWLFVHFAFYLCATYFILWLLRPKWKRQWQLVGPISLTF